jgi:polynucleotide 5'-kinase involved in rRNA processing
MANPRRADVSDVTELEPATATSGKPKLVVTHGRGGTGKSTFVRVMLERAQEVGREPAVADADLSMPVEISPEVPVENSPLRCVSRLC